MYKQKYVLWKYMICRVVPFPTTFSDPGLRFLDIVALGVLCAQLTRDMFAICMMSVSITVVAFLREPDRK